ncbi:Mu transposase C-terminal domain-containing protein [Curtobacterium flaccumfaciens]|uniref:Mu transposase C-terminal domain-containing protein n=1 Tax=Curtobacterium flaccumfaciens TaxID=2035 RepID=UPI003F7EF4E2
MTTQTRLVRRGTTIVMDDQSYVISEVRGTTVSLVDGTGRPAGDIPLSDAVTAAQQETAPPNNVVELHHYLERLPEKQRKRGIEDERILHLLRTGREPEDHPNQPPIPELDPKLLTLATRVTNLAAIRVKKLRKNGPSAGTHVKLRSERRHIERVIQRSRERGYVHDARTAKPRRDRQPDALWDELYEYLLAEASRSTRTIASLVRGFVAARKAARRMKDLPSERTLRNMIAALRDQNPEGLAGIAASRRSANNRPPASMRRRTTSRPGELVLFDTTKANVFIKDPRTGKKLRPEITIALDHYTRAIVGMSISVLTSGIGVGLCLADVLRPKTKDDLREWTLPGDALYEPPYVGVPATWGHVAGFTPEAIVSDNGKPFVSAFTSNQIARLGIDFEPQRSYTPTDKPQVERAFGTIKSLFEEAMQGFSGGGVHDKGADPAGERLMSGTLLERRLRQCIDLYNNAPHRGLVLEDDPFARISPFMMWKISIERDGAIRTTSWKHDWIRFLPSKSVVIGAGGVRLNRLQYQNAPLLDELRKDRRLGQRNLQVFYDPTDLRSVYCFDADGNAHELKWKYWREGLPRFGEVATNATALSLGGRSFTDAEFFDRLTSLFADFAIEDAAEAQAGHEDLEPTFTVLDQDEQRVQFGEDLLALNIARARTAASEPAAPAPMPLPVDRPDPRPKTQDGSPASLPAEIDVVDLSTKRHGLRSYRPGESWKQAQ